MNTPHRIVLILLLISIVEAQEVFKPENISEFLNKSNPFVSTLFNQEYLAQENLKLYESPFDTTLSSKYDTKHYPKSLGEYRDVYATKKIENGLEFKAGYRLADGTQEYNNIKTGQSGEVLLGLKMPVISLFKGINSDKANLQIAQNQTIKYKYHSKNNLRFLYLEVLKAYYLLIYNKAILNLEEELLKKANDKQKFVSKKVKVGLLPELSNIEIEQLIINRKQRQLVAKTNYENSFTEFLKYLNLSQNEFEERFKLNHSLNFDFEIFNLEESLNIAKSNRPDIKILELEKAKLGIDKKSADLLKYPDFDIALYGVHDLKYGSGFKVSLGMNFPIERSKYESKIGQYRQNIQNIEQLQEKKLSEIRTSLTNIIQSLEIIQTNIKNAEQEIILVKKLEDAENKKYTLGISNIFLLNQREIYTLDVKKKALEYKLNYLLLKENLKAEIGENFN